MNEQELSDEQLLLWGVTFTRTLVQTAYVEVWARTAEEAREWAGMDDDPEEEDLWDIAKDEPYEAKSVELIEPGETQS
jgi:hypothetical protein